MVRKAFPKIQEEELASSDRYEFDILNLYENINMDIQLLFTLMLLLLALRNLFNVRKWCKEKKVKPNKLYCINSNALLIIICNLYFSNIFSKKKKKGKDEFSMFFFFLLLIFRSNGLPK